MKNEGPPLEQLTRRLAECPPDFLDEPRIGNTGRVHVAAVISDLLMQLGLPGLLPQAAAAFAGDNQAQDRNRLQCVLVACWLMGDPWFHKRFASAEALVAFLDGDLRELARHAAANKFVLDADRREELSRYALARLELRPAGETAAQAQDRLSTISTAERKRLIAAAQKAEQRAREIREALARKRAEESADKWTRE
jgi:hypothetical protein